MKVVASDFDGTLYFQGIGFKEEDILKINEFQKQGHMFGICTGRSLKGILDVLDERIHLDFYIVASGALILDKDLHVINRHTIDKDIVIDVIDCIEEKICVDIDGINHRYSLNRDKPRMKEDIVLKDIHDLSEDVYSFSLHLKDEKEAKKYMEWLSQFKDIQAFQNIKDIDITKTGISKGSGINEIKDYYHIDNHCLAGIGDALNDLPMLKSVDIAYTFDTSNQEVKLHTDYIISSLAQCLEHLL